MAAFAEPMVRIHLPPAGSHVRTWIRGQPGLGADLLHVPPAAWGPSTALIIILHALVRSVISWGAT